MEEAIGILDVAQAMPDASSITTADDGIPIVGLMSISCMVFSDQDVTVDVDQGIIQHTNTKVYRFNNNFLVAAGTCEAHEFPIVGKYARVTITNNSGAVANVEAWCYLKGYHPKGERHRNG